MVTLCPDTNSNVWPALDRFLKDSRSCGTVRENEGVMERSLEPSISGGGGEIGGGGRNFCRFFSPKRNFFFFLLLTTSPTTEVPPALCDLDFGGELNLAMSESNEPGGVGDMPTDREGGSVCCFGGPGKGSEGGGG